MYYYVFKLKTTNKEMSESTKEYYQNFINKLCKFILNNLDEFVWDMYANHIVRSCMACLCGEPYLCSKASQQKSEKVDTSKDHKNLLKKYADYIINIQQFSGRKLN